MQIVRVTNYVKKSHEWGIKLYLKEDKKIEIPLKTVESFLSENILKLSTKNILFLREVACNKKIPTEFH